MLSFSFGFAGSGGLIGWMLWLISEIKGMDGWKRKDGLGWDRMDGFWFSGSMGGQRS